MAVVFENKEKKGRKKEGERVEVRRPRKRKKKKQERAFYSLPHVGRLRLSKRTIQRHERFRYSHVFVRDFARCFREESGRGFKGGREEGKGEKNLMPNLFDWHIFAFRAGACKCSFARASGPGRLS